MTLYLAIDDTDIPGTRGTGRLAREIAGALAAIAPVTGVTRHQLFVHPEIAYTSHNSCAVIHIGESGVGSDRAIFSLARDLLLADFIEGSDPGICIASHDRITPAVMAFGRRAKTAVLDQDQARDLARREGILLEGLGGTEDGVIGALAGIGLAASRNDGRFVQKGLLRQLRGVQPVRTLLSAGVDRILTPDGASLTDGDVSLGKFPKPSFLQGEAVLFVEPVDGRYIDLVRG
jgi:hypothetical protein